MRALLAVLGAGPVHAAATTPVRVGEHAGYGRVVFDLPEGAAYEMLSEEGRVLLVFRGAGGVVRPSRVPRNVVAVETGEETATLVLRPGARVRAVRIGPRLVLDVLDAPRPSRAGDRAGDRAGGPAGAEAMRRADGRVDASVAAGRRMPLGEQARANLVQVQPEEPAPALQERMVTQAPLPTLAAEPASEGAPARVAGPVARDAAVNLVAPVVSAGGPVPLAPSAPLAGPVIEPALLVRAEADVGAAAFAREGIGIVVFDRRIAADSLPPGATWVAGPVSMTLRLPLPAGSALRLNRVPAGWSIETTTSPAAGTVAPVVAEYGDLFPIARPGHVVALPDPVGGSVLLVGTSLSSGAELGVSLGRRTPEYNVAASWLGVVVEPLGDGADLRAVPKGFVLTGGSGRVPLVPTALARVFDFPADAPPALFNRLNAQLAGAAGAPVRSRSRERVGAAQTMLALGLGAEAASLLQLVASEDPQAAADAMVVGLRAVAALVSGRLGESGGLDDPRLDGTDEIELWRGLRDRQLEKDSEAARRLWAHADLARAYPAPLQRVIWPPVAEALAEGGRAVPDDELTPYARALQLEWAGRVDEAIAAFDAVVARPDRLGQVRATARGTELRLAAGRLSPADAAVIMERLAFTWRGDEREVGFRLRAAELQSAAGAWRAALDGLRGLNAMYPEQHAAVQAGKASVLRAMLLADGRGLSPLELVVLAAEYADGVPEGEEGGALAKLLADRLLALDLPARAIPIMQGLMKAAPAGAGRAEFGSRLGQLLLDGGNAAGAQTALDSSAAANLTSELQEARGLVQARIMASQGDLASAVARLMAMGTAGSDDLRATLLADAGDWRGCLGALTDMVAKRVPAEGVLPETAQELVLRQATAAARVPDAAMLRSLEPLASRMTAPRADLLRVLTSAPLMAASDLPRSARELRLARALPQQLQAIGPR